MIGLENKLKLYGFNNLTKTLSFNIYDVCYAKSEREQKDYIAYIDEQYNSELVSSIFDRFDVRAFKFTTLATFKKFQKQMKLLKPNAR